MRCATLIAVLFAMSMIAACRADDVSNLRKKYLSDPAVSADIKQAIEKRVVIPGMCPLQAFAAAGSPGFYQVTADKKWQPNIAPPVIINAQCEKPDDSVIWLTFRSKTQFGTPQAVVFYAHFEKGRVVEVTRTHKIKPDGT